MAADLGVTLFFAFTSTDHAMPLQLPQSSAVRGLARSLMRSFAKPLRKLGSLRSRRLKVPPRRVMVWSVFSALPMTMVVLLGTYLSYHFHEQLVQSRSQVDYTHRVLGEVNQLFILLQDAETGQRGFVITGDDSYLDPYQQAVEAAGPTFARLRQLLVGSAIQNSQMDRLEVLIDDKLGELREVIALRRQDGFASAGTRIAMGQGKQLMDAVRAEVQEVVRTEKSLLNQRQEVAKLRERELMKVGMYVAALSILMRIVLAITLVQLRKRRVLA
ncbi:CHASE3 domain-containing protein [Acidovorax sp. Leaf78]|uniref:CHASE3 domain-containing protein n=1 Tax=Acidovorax sp. Leaf78 TaxID=1736237 RepID=UPI0012E13BFF|nr:CHASE3 domain-containing protein [Acidovorax sp. Leaf78]